MKILSIRLKNINSLKGEHFIPFNKSPFTESGLFAITGPTGAGKSSVLDAITLALYGWAPRFNRDNPVEIMSYHTSDCLAEVEFEVKEKVYRSKWSIHRSRGKIDGEIQQARMELVDVMADVILESKKTDVINRVTEITGLDYFRFLRSVMLAQGDFAAFLKADEKARGELLEKITGTDIYTKISRRAFEKQKEKRQRLEQLESMLEIDKLLTSEKKETYLLQAEENIARNKALSQQAAQLTLQLQWLEKMETLHNRSVYLKTELQEAYSQKQAFQPELERYEKHLKTIVFQALYREVEITEQQIQDITLDIALIRNDIPLLETQKREAALAVQEAQQQLIHAKRKQAEAMPLLEQTAGIDRDLVSVQEQYRRSRQELEGYAQEISYQQQQLTHKQEQINQYQEKQLGIREYLQVHAQDACLESETPLIEQNLTHFYQTGTEYGNRQQDYHRAREKQQKTEQEKAVLEAQLKTDAANLKWTEAQLKGIEQSIAELLSGEDPEEIENRLQYYEQAYTARWNQVTFAKSFIERNDKIAALHKEISGIEKQFDEKQRRLFLLKDQLQQAQEKWRLLQKLCERENLILNYEEARHKLLPGEECPLCGSTHHPFASQLHEIKLSETERQRNEQELVTEAIEAQIDVLNKELVELESNRVSTLKNIQNYSLELAGTEKQFEEFNQQLSEDNHIHDLYSVTQKLKENISEKDRLRILVQDYRTKLKLRNDCKTQVEDRRQNLIKIENERARYMLILENNSHSLENLQKEIEILKLRNIQQQAALQQMLALYQLTIPDKANMLSWIIALKQRTAAFQAYRKQEKELETELAKLNVETAKVESSLLQVIQQAEKQKQATEKLQNQQVTLQEDRRKLFGDKNISVEKQFLQETIEKWEAQVRSFEKDLNDKQEKLSVRNQQFSDKQTLLHARQKQKAIRKDQLLDGLYKAGFTDMDHFQSCILDEATEINLKKSKESIEEKINGLKGALENNERELREQGARELTEAGRTEIAENLLALQASRETLIAETARIEQILDENSKLLEKHQQLSEGIEKFRKEYERWKILSDMIGSATGAEFNIFAQGLTLSRLVGLANRFLEKLNPRYHIRRKPHTDLELEIIDRYQADNIRTMKTLSGGETFLVSLALALGLSDLAGNKTRIDSLFVDEGFGTLDPQTLDIAITTLENLQATGKMIGIISHVEALKERITTQIQVTRQSGGVSSIYIVG